MFINLIKDIINLIKDYFFSIDLNSIQTFGLWFAFMLMTFSISVIIIGLISDFKDQRKNREGANSNIGTRYKGSEEQRPKFESDNHQNELEKWILKKEDEFNNYDNLICILKKIPKNSVVYNNLLNSFEWKLKRLEILVRDGFECVNCNKRLSQLQVHHKRYIKDEFPWEIENKYLETLCSKCHVNTHKKVSIPVYRKNRNGVLVKIQKIESFYCLRCSGSGWIPKYKHIQKGICFQCWGTSLQFTIFSKAIEKFNQTNKKRYEERQRKKLNAFLYSIDISTYLDKIK